MCTKEKGFSQYMYVLCGFQCIKSKISILNCNPTIHSLKSDKRIMDLKKYIFVFIWRTHIGLIIREKDTK